MRDLDIGRFIRLRNAIQLASDASDGDGSAVTLAESYLRFRAEALDLVPDENKDELQRLCPEIDGQEIGSITSGSVAIAVRVQQRELLAKARVLLGALAGFLDGYVEETKMRIEAEEKARLEAEKGGQYL